MADHLGYCRRGVSTAAWLALWVAGFWTRPPHAPNFVKTFNTIRLDYLVEMAAHSPIIFGGDPDDDVIRKSRSRFDVEMLQYRRGHYGDRYGSLNILHISTDLVAASGEIAKITRFLQMHGFTAECVFEPAYWRAADLLLVGSDRQHLECAVNLINRVPSNIGLVTPLDVLLYGPDSMMSANFAPAGWPLIVNKPFGLDGICLVHSRMRRWTDYMVFSGIFTTKIIGIENCIDTVMGWRDKWFADKVEDFEKKIKADGHWDSNAELFIAAVDFTRVCRNSAVHAQTRVPLEKSKDQTVKKLKAFNTVAIRHDRFDLYKMFFDNNFTGEIESMKHYIKLATLAHNWASEYARRYGQN